MAHVEEKNPAKIGRELRDMISTLTHHLTGLGNGGGSGAGMGIVTLAGSNKGAVMKGDLPDEGTDVGRKRGAREEPKLTAYTNNNYQSVNNSIMIDGRVEAEDPGVHIEIVDCVEEEDGEKSGNDDDEHEKGRKKKESSHEEKKEKKERSHEEKVKKEKKEKESSHEEEKEKREKKGKDEKGSG